MAARWTPETLARTLETVAEAHIVARLGYMPAVWYYGGSNHNDYRLFCTALDSGEVQVTDGNDTQLVTPDELSDLETVQGYVADWLDNTMPAAD